MTTTWWVWKTHTASATLWLWGRIYLGAELWNDVKSNKKRARRTPTGTACCTLILHHTCTCTPLIIAKRCTTHSRWYDRSRWYPPRSSNDTCITGHTGSYTGFSITLWEQNIHSEQLFHVTRRSPLMFPWCQCSVYWWYLVSPEVSLRDEIGNIPKCMPRNVPITFIRRSLFHQ